MKTCIRCGNTFSRRDNERPGRFNKRVYCGRVCSDQGRWEEAERTSLARFWTRVSEPNESGCWEWTGNCNNLRFGYGVFYVHGKNVAAHRYSYECHFGPIGDGLVVMHTCDNPRCVNPSHLQAGTHADNVRDCVNKGRKPLGESAPKSKLKNAEAYRIRDDGRKYADIAAEFGVSTATVSLIKSGKNWAWLDGQKDNGL